MATQEGSLPISIPCSASSSTHQHARPPSSFRQESYSSVLSTGLAGSQTATNVPSAALCDHSLELGLSSTSTGSLSNTEASSSSSSSSAALFRPRSYSSFGPGEHVHPADSPDDHRSSPSADLSSLTTPTGDVQSEPVASSTRASFLAAFSSFGLPPLPTLTIPEGNSRLALELTSVEPSPASSFLSSFSSPTISSQVTSSSSLSSFSPLLPSLTPTNDFPVFDHKFIGRLLGKGSTGSVREVLSFPNKERLSPPQAVKIVLLPKPKLKSTQSSTSTDDDELGTELASEISLWASLPSHPNILPLLSSERTQDAIFLFMPYMVSGSLFDLVRRHREHDRGRGRRLVSSFRSFSHVSTSDRSTGQPIQSECAGSVGVGRSATLRESGVGGGLRFFPEDDARKLFRDIVAGLQVLHREGIVHGDLKSENVLVDEEGHCKLSDFGFSHRLEVSQPQQPVSLNNHTNANNNNALASLQTHGFPSGKSVQIRQASSPLPRSAALNRMTQSAAPPFIPPSGGSMPYTAPELLQPAQGVSGAQQRTTLMTDMWALGVLLHFLLTTGSFPFQDAFEPRLQMKILRGVWSMPEEVGGGRLGREAESLLKGMLEVQADERWTVDEVGRSEWLAGWAEVRKSSRSRSRSRAALGVSGQATRRRSKSTHRSARIDENPGVPSSPSRSSSSYQSTSLFGSSVESYSSVDSHHTQINSWSDQTYLPPTPHQSLSPPLPHAASPGSLLFPSGSRTPKSRSRSGSRDTRWRRRAPVESVLGPGQSGQRAESDEGWGTLSGEMIEEVEEPGQERRGSADRRRSRSRGRRREVGVI